MLSLKKVFGSFQNFEKVIERSNPCCDVPIVNLGKEDYKERDVKRYVLVKLVEDQLESVQIFGGKDPYAGIFDDEERIIPPMENPPKTAVKGKRWEKASYIVRFSRGYTHLGIAGTIMAELREKVPACTPCLHQSGHGEPATIAKTDKFNDYATVVGAGFAKIDPDKKTMVLYGRSRAFTVKYNSQVKYHLGITGHEFVAKMLQSELPKGWKVTIVNNDVEASISDEREIMPNPE